VPIAVKDQIDVFGHSILDGKDPSKAWESARVKLIDDKSVARFRAAGCIIFGVTIMTEGGTTPLGYNKHFRGPVNPYSLDHYSGGSSAGSAVAVATGLVPIAIGFDGGGSIRIPAALCGIHGLATTFGRIPFDSHYSSTMIKSGPLALSALDAAMGLAVMAAPSSDDFYSNMYDGGVRGPPRVHVDGLFDVSDFSGVRIGIFPEWFEDGQSDAIAACRTSLQHLVDGGAELVKITIPHLHWMGLSHGIKIASEFAMGWDLLSHTRLDDLDPNTRITVTAGGMSMFILIFVTSTFRLDLC
jgi:Asp-tRNA(Asn)/Glu-tRNA(Gln) amidotransferase A subunit family amidase